MATTSGSPSAKTASSSRVQPDPTKLINEHQKLVSRTARQVFMRISGAIEIDDLTQIGMVALIESARNYEDRGEATFASFAAMRIRGSMLDQLRKRATISRGSMQTKRKFDNARRQLEVQLGRTANVAEMAASVNMPVQAYQAAAGRTQSAHFVSLDDTEADYTQSLCDDAPNAFDALKSGQLQADLATAIGQLPERQALAIQLFYLEGLDLESIGEVLGVSSVRACQIKKAGLTSLSKRLRGWRNV